MHTNYTNRNINKDNERLIYPELSFALTGILFNVHNSLGRYAREKQYGDMSETQLKNAGLNFVREYRAGTSGNIIDFVVEQKIVLEIKAMDSIAREDYYQTQRYLQSTKLKLGFLINFRNRYLKPVRVVRIDTSSRLKYN